MDVRRYLSGGSLSRFVNDWGIKENKSIYPYDLFKSIAEIKECRTFPKYKEFISQLGNPNYVENLSTYMTLSEEDKKELNDNEDIEIKKLHICPKTYLQRKHEFNEKIAIGEYSSFLDYLKAYNINDTKILSLAFKKYIDAFKTSYGENPTLHMRNVIFTFLIFFKKFKEFQ